MAEGALRLDKYLWFSRLAKSRTAAQTLCESRRLRVDGRVIERASVPVKPGQVIVFPQGQHVRVLRVEKLPERRGPFIEAQKSYADLAPPAIDGRGHGALAGAH